MKETLDTMPAMELKSMPLDAAAEVLQYLADNDNLDSVSTVTTPDMNRDDIRKMLHELAIGLRRIVAERPSASYDAKKDKNLTPKSRRTLTYLSPREEKHLLTAFGLIDRR